MAWYVSFWLTLISMLVLFPFVLIMTIFLCGLTSLVLQLRQSVKNKKL